MDFKIKLMHDEVYYTGCFIVLWFFINRKKKIENKYFLVETWTYFRENLMTFRYLYLPTFAKNKTENMKI